MSTIAEKLLELFLASKGALAAGILVVGSTGVVITGVVGPGNDIALAVLAPVVSPSPSPSPSPSASPGAPTPAPAGCAAAIAARDEALKALGQERDKALADLRTIRRTAAALAKAGNRELSEALLEEAEREFAAQAGQRLEAAKRAIHAAADLAACDAKDPDRGAFFDIADLRERYRVVREQLRTDLRELLQRAGQRFDELLKDAKVKQPPVRSTGSGDSDDSDSSDDD